MGAPMAGHLLAAGQDLVVWSRTAGKDDDLVERGATRAADLTEMGRTCDAVCLCVNRTEDVAQCLDGLAKEAKASTLFVDHSTIAPSSAIQFESELSSKGLMFVDAPLTGGSMGAQRGALTIFCGGQVADVEAALPILAAYARRSERVGGPGAGQMMKMANQIAVAGSLLGLCEAMSFAKKAGLNLHQVKELVGSGAAGSWAFENYGPKILAEDWSPGFSVRNQRKDLAYCFDAAATVDAALPTTEVADRLLSEVEDDGHGDWTTASLFEKLLEHGWQR